jgi:uncharacterized protein (DUF697 family)
MPLSAPSFVDPNAAAASNARGVLGNIGNFLYEQQVQKPAVQAQTAQTQAGTAQTQVQTQLLQQQLAAGTMQQNLARLQLARQNLFSPDQNTDLEGSQVNPPDASTAFRPQATDVSTSAATPSSAMGSTVSASDTGSMGPNSSGGQPGSSSSPTAAIHPPVSGVGPGTGNSAGVPQAVDWTKPNVPTRPTRLAPLPSSDLSDVSLTKPSTPAGTPGQSGTTATVPGPSAVSPLPAVTSPASLSRSQSPDILSSALGKTYDQLTPEQQAEVLRRGHSKLTGAGFGGLISDAGMVKEWNEQQQATTPLASRPAGATVTTGKVPLAGGGEGNIINADATQTIGGAGLPEGTYRDVYTGEIKTDPNHATPPQAAETQDTLSSISQMRQKIANARTAINRTPGIVGGGGIVQGVKGKIREGESAASDLSGGKMGTTIPAEDEASLGLFTSGQFINSLAALKGIGRMDIPVVEGVKGGIISAGQPLATWKSYLDTVDKALSDKEKIVNDEFTRQTKGSKTALPQLDSSHLPVDAGAPGQSTTGGLKTFTPEQVKALPKGYGQFMGSNGKIYTK